MKKFWDNPALAAASLRGAGVSPTLPGIDREVKQSIRSASAMVPPSLQIGNITIAPATVLAPMAGVTDTVFRRFIRNLGGCGLIMTEFTSADGVLRAKDQKAKRYLHFYEDEHPISAQLFGSDPQVMADAARIVEDLGFDLVDLNLGCPAKKVVKCNGGSGLLRDLPRIAGIFEAVRSAVNIPFTVKFRAGWNDEEIVCVELAKIAEDCGLCAVALHARTREQGYSGNARWEWIAAVKDAVKIPVIGNGDIRTPEDACAMVAATGCDAVMIGRTAPANPWIFRQITQYCDWLENVRCNGEIRREGSVQEESIQEAGIREGTAFSRAESDVTVMTASAAEARGAEALDSFGAINGTAEAVLSRVLPAQDVLSRTFPDRTVHARNRPSSTFWASGKPYDEPSESDRYDMIRTYFQMLIEEELPDATGKMKQFASWFTHGVPGGAALRKAIYDSKAAPEILARVEEFFEARLTPAVATVAV